MIYSRRLMSAVIILIVVSCLPVIAQQEPANDFDWLLSNLEVHGFYDRTPVIAFVRKSDEIDE